MRLLILIQTGYSELSVHFLWILTLTLALLTVALFLASLTARANHRRHEKKVEDLKEKIYPLILEYMEGELTDDEVEEHLSEKGREYAVFEEIIFDMLENLEGEDAQKLQKLLYLPPLFNYHVEQLQSRNEIDRIKACNYLSYVRLINFRIIEQLMEFLFSPNQMLAFSAASALMASKDISIRAEALKAIANRTRISNMALLEMFYKFHYEQEDQLEEEGAELIKIINDDNIPVENLDLIIVGISEVGYHQLAGPFLEKLQSDMNRWNHPDVLSALIRALGNYFNLEAAPTIRQYIYHDYARVRKAAAETLGIFGQEEDLKALYNLLYDDDFQVKLTAAESLLDNGEEGRELLERSFRYEHLETEPIAKSLKSHK